MAPESRDEAARDEVRQRIDSLYDQAENATGNYNATRAMASVTRSRGVPLAKRPGRRPDPALDEIARQWFEGARAKLGPTVPAVLPDGPAATGRSRGRTGGSPGALGRNSSARRSEALERAAERAVTELTAGRATDPESLALAARESARAALPGPRRPELPSGGTRSTPLSGTGTAGASTAGLALSGAAAQAAPDPRGVPADLAPVQPGGLGTVSPAGLGAAELTALGAVSPAGLAAAELTGLGAMSPGGLGTAEPTSFGTTGSASPGTAQPTGLGPLQPGSLGTVSPAGLGAAELTALGAVSPAGLAAAELTGLGTVSPAGLGAAEPTGLGPMYPAGPGTAPPDGPGPVETAVLPVTTLSAAPGTPVQEAWTHAGPSAPGRPSPATSKASNQRKLAAASLRW
uniref:hypothetical protein n=1 Tax=Streptomyces puniciscabiei TaxID=164348 RepID=UPI0006EB4B43